MRAALFRGTGPADEVLSVEEVEPPPLGPNDVGVRVSVSAVNPTDWKERSRGAGPGEAGFKVPNQDGAGTIEAVGADVDPARVGERVWVYFAAWKRRWGTAAELCVLPSRQAVALPDSVSDDLGASLGIPALTAHRCLFADGPIDGATVLVSGGAGAVGHYAIELAKWRGARVITTVSGDQKAELAADAGADAVVNYRVEDAAERIAELAPAGVDRVVEVALHRNLDLDRAVCGEHASIAAYANGGSVKLAVRELMVRNLNVRFVLVYTMPEPALALAVSEVSEALAAGALSELPAHRFTLDRIAAAHDAVEAGAVGKVLVDLAG
ncbi:MAG: zinc-binding dehydrogenase [Solirubrobacterales bacterium]|nr:zinc-binding dehydrogenase [Solirubrobacterales bacterium]